MASMLGDTHIKAKWLLMRILFKSQNKLVAGQQSSEDCEATMRPNLLKARREHETDITVSEPRHFRVTTP
jgi:hypothetical protein